MGDNPLLYQSGADEAQYQQQDRSRRSDNRNGRAADALQDIAGHQIPTPGTKMRPAPISGAGLLRATLPADCSASVTPVPLRHTRTNVMGSCLSQVRSGHVSAASLASG